VFFEKNNFFLNILFSIDRTLHTILRAGFKKLVVEMNVAAAVIRIATTVSITRLVKMNIALASAHFLANGL